MTALCYHTFMDNKTAEEKYIELSEKIKELELLKDNLNKEIIGKMAKEGETNMSTGKGEFVLAWRKSWEYTNETQHMEVLLKENKKREENEGKAVISKQTSYLRFIPKKEKE